MDIRNRIKGLRTVQASTLRHNPRNWRTHNSAQRDALKGLLAEVGYAVPVLARELPDGSLQLIDGHLRAETLQGGEISVCVLDVTEEEADKMLLTLDPLAGLAGQDDSKVVELMATVTSDSAAVQALIASLYKLPTDGEAIKPVVEAPEASYNILIECKSESEQAELLERLTAEGVPCKSLIS